MRTSYLVVADMAVVKKGSFSFLEGSVIVNVVELNMNLILVIKRVIKRITSSMATIYFMNSVHEQQPIPMHITMKPRTPILNS